MVGKKQPSKPLSFWKTITTDFREGDLKGSFRRDLDESIAYFLDDFQKEKLKKSGRFKQILLVTWWFLVALFRKLSPIRRILFVVALFLLVSGNQSSDTARNALGGLILVYLLLQELKDKSFAKDELSEGRAVQMALMPVSMPEIRNYDVWLYTRPANDVGGDLVDHMVLEDETHGIALGDVAGKGLSAALYMAKLQSTLRALASADRPLSDLVSSVNRIFCRDSQSNRFASLLFLTLDSASTKIRFINAGHFPPLLVFENRVVELEKGHPALGLADDVPYGEFDTEIPPGAWMLLYSDGATECQNSSGDFLGMDRFKELAGSIRAETAEGLGLSLLEALDDFRGSARMHDDLSLVVMRRTRV